MHWVGAKKHDAEGSFMQLQDLYGSRIRRQLGATKAVSRQLDFFFGPEFQCQAVLTIGSFIAHVRNDLAD